MEKLDGALANSLEQIIDALKKASGPTWDMLLATCRVQAHGEIMSFYITIGMGLLCFVIAAGLIIAAIKNSSEDCCGPLSGFGCGFTVAFLVFVACCISGMPRYAIAKATVDHPEVCVGKVILDKINASR